MSVQEDLVDSRDPSDVNEVATAFPSEDDADSRVETIKFLSKRGVCHHSDSQQPWSPAEFDARTDDLRRWWN